jgi:hypothetical protein
MEEKRNHQSAAIDYLAKAFTINPALLDVRVNPRILDSNLVDIALIKAYPNDHSRQSMAFNPAPPGYVQEGLITPPKVVGPSSTPPAAAPQPVKPPK